MHEIYEGIMGLNQVAKEAIDYCNYWCVMNCHMINLFL